MVRLFISTGEVSGDLQGALLVEALQRQSQALGLQLEIVALGGDRMAAAGATLVGHTTGLSSIGLIEALPYVVPTLQLQRRARQYLQQHPPDLVVLIDYIAANVPLGNFIRQNFSIPVVYYIAPQEWVWHHSDRMTRKIVALSDRLLAIFPEEATYYRAHGANVTWVGHPLLERIQTAPTRQQARQSLGLDPTDLAVALFPASRQQEIHFLLPPIFEAAQQIQTQLNTVKFFIPLSRDKYRQSLIEAIQTYGLRAHLVNDPLQVLAAADLAIAKSGTVNLEAALLNVPQVVIYRVNPLSLWLFRRFVDFSPDYVSPVNLVQRQPIVPELLQEQATGTNIAQQALELLLNPARRQTMLQQYEQMRLSLGTPGAVERAAQEILQLLSP
uniref:Lipid-A-disaccharide synthase n=1 Tax=Cyanothece sp. (strain PCC 7425 / ATCC 29141) TaxID=395961 RepID=B8HK61_CYAP4